MGLHSFAACLILSCITSITCSSAIDARNKNGADDNHSYRIMFYNVENLFDVADDSVTTDEAFTPAGDMHWTNKRYTTKLTNICKVIIAAGSWKPPDIIGFCEVENGKVLQDLLNNTPLSKFPFRMVHYDSPDKRGIDVALIYNEKTIDYLHSTNHRINRKELYTRDILHVKALIGKDTCHFFVNHWPSRSAGQLETEKDRFAAALLLKHLTDSLFSINPDTRIIIMGDFNDEPTDESLVFKLNARVKWNDPTSGCLYNLSVVPPLGLVKGTLKYQGEWNTFDQIIVSGSLLSHTMGISVNADGFRMLKNQFLLETDEKYNGYKPFRTYNGFIYRGGFSDHLPVYVDLISKTHP